MTTEEIIAWLLEGDVSIQYQAYRDLLDTPRPDLQARISEEGWGGQLLSKRSPRGHWGKAYYQPKWTSTHYTLLDLRLLNVSPGHPQIRASLERVLRDGKAEDGGIPLGPSTRRRSDVCANGMFLNFASYFLMAEPELCSILDILLRERMPDGGFNCWTTHGGATHSSLHSTLSVLEGFLSYIQAGHNHRLSDLLEAKKSAEEFILVHQLFLSDRTGQIINKDFLKLTFPGRWRYDILRALDYFQDARAPWDERMRPAMDVLLKKRNKDGTWNMQAAHPGQVHFIMEKAGRPSRWNTLRALRVLKRYSVIAN